MVSSGIFIKIIKEEVLFTGASERVLEYIE